MNDNITKLMEAIAVIVKKSQAGEPITFMDWINVSVAVFAVLGSLTASTKPVIGAGFGETTESIHVSTRELLEMAVPQQPNPSQPQHQRAIGKLGDGVLLAKLLEIMTKLLPLIIHDNEQ